MKKLLIVEDMEMFKDFIVALVDGITGLEVVASTGDGEEALALIDRLEPDVVILDIMLEGMNGTEIASRINSRRNRPALLVVSGSLTLALVNTLTKLGVEGIVRKMDKVEELDKAIRLVSAGQIHYSPSVTALMRELMLRGADDSPDNLTDRERQIVKLVAESSTNKQIATKLGISVKTVETHRAHIIQKLEVHDTAGLTRYAIANRLIVLPEVTGS